MEASCQILVYFVSFQDTPPILTSIHIGGGTARRFLNSTASRGELHETGVWILWRAPCQRRSSQPIEILGLMTQPDDTTRYKFRHEDCYKTKGFNLSDIEVALFSVANWVICPT